MRILRSSLAVAMLILGATFLVPGLADAQAAAPAAGDCPQAAAYPLTPNASIEVSATAVDVGQTVEVSGRGFCASQSIVITIGGTTVGTARTDSTGTFDPPVVVPKFTGTTQLCGTGATGLARDRDCLTLSARSAAPAAAGSTPVSTNSGGTAFTGVRVALLTVVALLLLVGGIALATAGRNRKASV